MPIAGRAMIIIAWLAFVSNMAYSVESLTLPSESRERDLELGHLSSIRPSGTLSDPPQEWELVLRPNSLSLVVGGPSRRVFPALRHMHGAIRPIQASDPNLFRAFDSSFLDAQSEGIAVILSALKETNTTVVFIYLQEDSSFLIASLPILATKTTMGLETGIINVCLRSGYSFKLDKVPAYAKMSDQSKSDVQGQLDWIIREGAGSVVNVAGQDLVALAPGEAILQGTWGKSLPLSESRSILEAKFRVVPAESSTLIAWLRRLFVSLLDSASEALLGKKRKTYLRRVEVGVISLEALTGYGLDLNQIEATAFFSNGSTEDVTGQLDWNVTQGSDYVKFHDGDYVLNFIKLVLGQVESSWEEKTSTIDITVSNHQP